MPDLHQHQQFPHLQLRLTNADVAKLPSGGSRKIHPITLANRGNAKLHGQQLESSIKSIIENSQDTKKEREQEGKPDLPDAVSFILHIDPDLFDAEDLRSFGVEIVADLEEGYIIGASTDTELSELRKRIGQFINSQKGGGKVPAIWEILEGTQRPDYILSPALKAQWGNILENQEYVVDVGIACIDIREQYSRCPKQERFKSNESFQKSINRWLDKHNLSLEAWDDLYSERTDQLQNFINEYNGEILKNIMGDDVGISRLPDSFSCRIRILGKGLKDLVLNFPYIFDVSEIDEFCSPSVKLNQSELNEQKFELVEPDLIAPKVCVIDSGIQERHPKLGSAVDSSNSKSWVPGEPETADYVQGGGHGTRVAGAILYPREIPQTGLYKAICWIQNARILDQENQLPQKVFPPEVLEEIVEFYYHKTRTRIFNHSVAGISPCRTQSMAPWAAAIDKLTWENDVLFIVAAGNIEANASFVTRPSIAAHIQAGRSYPDYLLSPSARIANPAQSFQALTVGSVAQCTYRKASQQSIAEKDYPSSFSCTGFGIWNTIKPEVVEYGGDYVIDSLTSSSFTQPKQVCPELIRSTRNGGQTISADAVGTSYAAPKVAHIAASLAAVFPQESTLLYRALIVQSARLPSWTNESVEKLSQGIRMMGYGIPNHDRALGNSLNRVTLTTQGREYISAGQARIYQIQIPEILLRQDQEFEILIEITLSYVAEPRRTRRHRRKYLSTWLDWRCSNKGEDPERFLEKVLKEYESPSDAEKSKEGFNWTLGQRKDWGLVKDTSRSIGTLQKDWAVVKSFNLRESFCVAVVGHRGWNNDPTAQVPYSLVVSFEAINSEIPIYTSFVEAQIPLEVQQQVQVTV